MRSLVWKLTAAFWAVSLIGIVFVSLFASQMVQSRSAQFEDDVSRTVVLEQLEDIYMRNDGWPRRDATQGPRSSVEWRVVNEEGRVLFANRRDAPRASPEQVNSSTEIEIDGENVGNLVIITPTRREVNQAQQQFVEGFQSSVFYGALGVTMVALVIGLFMSRRLVRPIRQLTIATRAIAQGNLDQQVDVNSADEIGQLATAFNQMGSELAHSQHMRRQMTADIAHDLRTPLSVILGHAEGLIDGVLPADEETFAIIHDEAIRLNRLIEDLRTLTLAEAGELPLVKRLIEPHMMLERAAQAHSPKAQLRNVAVIVDASASLPSIQVDPDRMAQVLDNLVSNALRYTPEGGTVALSASNGHGQLQIQVRDSGKGIPADQLPHIFERFYRADKSRRRDGSGSGLGLSITKSIVEQHGGQISAESTPNIGTTFTIQLPVE